MKKITILAGCILAPLALLSAGNAASQTFPQKPVTLIVPYPPGGGSDNIARATANALTTKWKQPVLVENRPGADGMIAPRAVTREKPDGYTLLITIPAVAALKYINKIDGEDPLAHLKPVSLFASGPTGVVVKGGTNINSIEDFKKTCEKPDAKCSWASGEPFTLLVGTALLEDLGLTDVVNVRYPGTSVAVNDIIGGRVTMVVTGLASIVPHHKSGTMKILAVSTDERQAQIPEVPTYAQAGMGAVKFVNNWYGIFAPRDTPDAVVEQISVAMREAGKDPSVVNVLSPLMIKPVGSTPKEFQAVVKQAEQDVARLSKHLQSQ